MENSRGFFKLILTAGLLTISVSCARSVNSGAPSGSGGAPASASGSGLPGTPGSAPTGPKSDGTLDSGGGNTYRGLPLESYIQKPEDLPAFQSLVKPILAKINPYTAGVLEHVLKKKTWYFVPGKLSELPASKIGSAVKVEQGALQDFRQVWVASEIFEAMEARDQARLLMHELLMGFRLLRFDSVQNECVAFDGDVGSCANLGEKLRGAPSDLTEKDYANIRAAVAEVFEVYEKFDTPIQWDDFFWRFGFSSFQRRFSHIQASKKYTEDGIVHKLEAARLAGNWPTHGGDLDKAIVKYPEFLKGNFNPKIPVHIPLTEPCDFNVNVKDRRYFFALKIPGRDVNYSTSYQESRLLESEEMEGMDGVVFERVTMMPDRKEKTSRKGHVDFSLSFDFIGFQLRLVNIYETVCLNDDCSEFTKKSDGLNYMCSAKEKFTIGKE